jgi:hypothetical protein
VTTTAGPADRRSVAFPGGAALTGGDGTWVLADAAPARSLGPALVVGLRHGGPVHLVVDDAAGLLTRRALQFAEPPVVWFAAGSTLEVVQPEPLPIPPPIDPGVVAFADLITAAGAHPVVEHGRLVAEVEGLEVARVVVDEHGPHLEVGVGRFDREANALIGAQTLESVVELVAHHRHPGAEPHPLNRLAAARGLRARVVADPALVGAAFLTPVASVMEAPDLRTPWPAPAVGVDLDGGALVVVCSVGVDLDLVPAAADARLADGREARLILAVPERDAHDVTGQLAALLRDPAEIITL